MEKIVITNNVGMKNVALMEKINGKFKLKVNRLCQLGRVLKFKNISFTFVGGAGLLRQGSKQTWGATISDFEKLTVPIVECNISGI